MKELFKKERGGLTYHFPPVKRFKIVRLKTYEEFCLDADLHVDNIHEDSNVKDGFRAQLEEDYEISNRNVDKYIGNEYDFELYFDYREGVGLRVSYSCILEETENGKVVFDYTNFIVEPCE